MNAADLMVRHVDTVHPETGLADAIKLLTERDISSVPVVDAEGILVGILSQSDLLHRVELGTQKHRPWLLEHLTSETTLAEEFAKSHGKKVGEIMTPDVVTVTEDTTLVAIANLFERHRIRRVPVVREGKLVGTVSQSNLIQALASTIKTVQGASYEQDQQIRSEILARLAKQQSWTDFGSRNVTVSDGVVHLWGLINSDAERNALLALVEEVPGVNRVSDEMFAIY